MAVFSKILCPFSTISCHELVHPWSPSCIETAAEIFQSCFVESVKIYGLLYLAGGVFRKAGIKYFKYQYLVDVVRSTCFLAINGGAFVSNICLARKILGYFNFISVVYIPALIASLMAIVTEKKSRRSTLALYMSNLAVETSYNMLKSRGIVHPVPNGEILLFCAATGAMMYLYRSKDGMSDGLLNTLIRFFMGPNDSGIGYQLVGGSKASEADNVSRKNKCHVPVKWIKPAVKAFVTGYLTQLVPLLFGELSLLFKCKKPGRLLKAFYNKNCIRCGIFLGSCVAIFKIVEYAMAVLMKQEDEINALVAGALSGLSMVFFRSSTISLYLASKIAEVLYKKGVSAGVVPAVPYGPILFYSFSTALLFHASSFEVQNVRPSYWRYLNVVTAKRFCEINRKRLDEIFGTDSAKLFPKDDLYRSLRRR